MDDKHHSLINSEIETSSGLFMWTFIPQQQIWAARTWTEGPLGTVTCMVGDGFWVVVIFLEQSQAKFCIVMPWRLLFMTAILILWLISVICLPEHSSSGWCYPHTVCLPQLICLFNAILFVLFYSLIHSLHLILSHSGSSILYLVV